MKASQPLLGALMRLPSRTVDEFDVFWGKYPKKRSKPAARRAFLAAKRRHGTDAIMAGLARHRFSSEVRFVPYPASWLNQERYLEEPEDLAADPWGLLAWYGEQPAQGGGGLFWVRGYEVEALVDVLLAAGFAVDWRGDLDVLGRWLVDGYRPDSIAEAVAEACGTASSPVRTLRWLDGRVRRRAYRWHAVRGEWVRA